MAKISIIIPIYNVREYLAKCIESVINQTYQDIEIICVDDGSTDGSYEICEYYKKKDSRIKVVHKINEGIVSARQTGLKIANGEYVGFVDGDDWIDEKMYESMIRTMEKSNVDMVETGVIDSYNSFTEKERKYKLKEGIYKSEKFKKNILNNLIYDGKFYNYGVVSVYLWNKLFKRKYITECYMKLDYKQSMFEDFVSVYPYLIKHQSIAIINKAFYHYRVVNNSTKRRDLKNANEVLLLHVKTIKECINNSKYKNMLLLQLNYFMLFFLLIYNIKIFDLLSQNILIPYGGITHNDIVILYGCGVNGINIYRYLKQNSECKIVNWVDKNFKNINFTNIGIKYAINSPETINCNEKAKIIITPLNETVAEWIKEDLKNKGISDEKILWIEKKYIENPELLLKILE